MVDFSVFNELSLPFSLTNPNNSDVENIFKDFFKLLNILKNKGLQRIRMEQELADCKILENVTFYQFFNQVHDRDFKERLRLFKTNDIIQIDTPIIQDDDPDEIIEDFINNIYLYDGKQTSGGFACTDIWNTIAISFNTDNKWNIENIVLQKKKENNNISEENDIKVRHASLHTHLCEHEYFFRELEIELRLNITQETFWGNRDTLFHDKIILCKEVEHQIKTLGKVKFHEALSILRDLEKGFTQLSDYKISGEGQTVKGNPKLNKLRKFTINDTKEFFWNHIKNFGDHRIHYIERGDKIYIGYIGPHLPTKNDS